VNALGEFLSNLKVRGRSFHPEDVSIITEDNTSCYAISNGAFNFVVALFCSA